MVALQILVLSVQVRILVSQQNMDRIPEIRQEIEEYIYNVIVPESILKSLQLRLHRMTSDGYTGNRIITSIQE